MNHEDTKDTKREQFSFKVDTRAMECHTVELPMAVILSSIHEQKPILITCDGKVIDIIYPRVFGVIR